MPHLLEFDTIPVSAAVTLSWLSPVPIAIPKHHANAAAKVHRSAESNVDKRQPDHIHSRLAQTIGKKITA